MKYRGYEGDAAELIERNLSEVERVEGVRILRAVESGSRAWGFASPDSDYDVRFIYIRPPAYYLSLRPGKKDTIEWVVDETLDICGWDISKALALACKGNIYLFEWSGSPVVYRSTEDWELVWQTVRHFFSCKAALHSYHGIASNTERDFLRGSLVRYKKYLYAVRPLLACKYIEELKGRPPVAFNELVEAVAEDALKPAIELLLERKATMGEKDEGPRIPEIDEFVSWGLDRYGKLASSWQDDRVDDWDQLDSTFMKLLGL